MKWGYGTMVRSLCAALLALVACQARAESDKVTVLSGGGKQEVVTGRINKDDRDGLEVEVKDARTGAVAKQTFNTSQVVAVEYDVPDENYHDAVTAYRINDFSTASTSLANLIGDKDAIEKVRPVVRPYIQFLYAECLYRKGKVAEAFTEYDKFVKGFKNSRYVPLALGSMTEAAIRAKAFDKLPALLTQLRDGGGDQKQMADYYEAEGLMAQGKAKEALSKYGTAASGSVVRIKALAFVGQARAMADTGD
jgi:predicted Zn-dependent protease